MLATKRHVRHDIVCLIREAIDLGDLNEALWRAFLAIHFCRCSANLRTSRTQPPMSPHSLHLLTESVYWLLGPRHGQCSERTA
jgi:hypothetical protein